MEYFESKRIGPHNDSFPQVMTELLDVFSDPGRVAINEMPLGPKTTAYILAALQIAGMAWRESNVNPEVSIMVSSAIINEQLRFHA